MPSDMSINPSASAVNRDDPHDGSRIHSPHVASSKPFALPFGTYRPGPPSVSSTITQTATSSYAESLASDLTVIPSRSSKHNNGQVSKNPLRIKVDTSVAPSSHIWDEFYAASGGAAVSQHHAPEHPELEVETVSHEGEPQGKPTEDGLEDISSQSGMSNAVGGGTVGNEMSSSDALSELLSMFDMPQFPTHEPSSINQHPPNSNSDSNSSSQLHQYQIGGNVADDATTGFQNGQFPGAEFLNLPDTASTTDNSIHPALFDDFDFSHFTFPAIPQYGGDPSNPSIATGNTLGTSLQGHGSSSTLGSSPLDDAALTNGNDWPKPISTDGMHTEDHSLLLHQPYPTSVSTCIDTTHPAPSLVLGHQSSVAKPASVHVDAPHASTRTTQVQDQENNSTRVVTPWSSTESHSHQSSPSFPDKSQTGGDRPQSKSTHSVLPGITKGKPHHLFPHLARVKMGSMKSDRSVLAFQREVLRVAAEFYKGIAQVFESTPSEVLQLGMSRTGGVLVEDDTLADVLHDIKSLCSRLTVKAASLPGYPHDGENTSTANGLVPDLEPSPSKPNQRPTRFGLPRTGSALEPIDLTAPTPKSHHVSSPLVTGPELSSVTSSHLVPPLQQYSPRLLDTAAVSPAHTEWKKQKETNPFTPESLSIGTSMGSSLVTTPATYHQPSNNVTPSAAAKQMNPIVHRSSPITPQPQHRPQTSVSPPQRRVPDLPPLPSPSSNRLIHGPWKSSEIERLRTLVSFSTDVEDGAPIDHVDWTWVVDNFGGTRNRHQVLIKAVELGLRESSTHHSRKVKQKGYREALEAMHSDLHEASIMPLTSPLPPLLPSARINEPPDSPTTGSIRRLTSDSPAGDEGLPRKRYKLALSPSELPETDRTPRGESSSTAPSEGLKTPEDPPIATCAPSRPIPRALDLSLAAKEDAMTSPSDQPCLSMTPKRPTTASLPLIARSPSTPQSTLRSMAFKAYAHPSTDSPKPGTRISHPATAPPRFTYPRAWSGGWGVVALPASEVDSRPSVISPNFGSFGDVNLVEAWSERK